MRLSKTAFVSCWIVVFLINMKHLSSCFSGMDAFCFILKANVNTSSVNFQPKFRFVFCYLNFPGEGCAHACSYHPPSISSPPSRYNYVSIEHPWCWKSTYAWRLNDWCRQMLRDREGNAHRLLITQLHGNRRVEAVERDGIHPHHSCGWEEFRWNQLRGGEA